MKIILSQKIDTESSYQDTPFSKYHFPRSYINQIHPGDQFIYYQGNKSKKEHRYYFGYGVVGNIEADSDGEHFFAEVLDGSPFKKVIPIYLNADGGYIESLGYSEVRNKPMPAWRSSIRKLSNEAYFEILKRANADSASTEISHDIESQLDPLKSLMTLNARLKGLPPKELSAKAQTYLDRGSAVTTALKKILGSKCQICDWQGFTKKQTKKNSGPENFIEAHHLTQISEQKSGSLCTENILLVCPNCHREIHYGSKFSFTSDSENIYIKLSNIDKTIRRNSIDILRKILKT